ncbi:MAG: hypothetical protein MUP17_12960 [candidate division Zixibacteria bacterium]|nr:hypothetical protein [candidate division Zixibacteria bacterium]
MRDLRKRIDKIQGIIEETNRTLPERFEKSLSYKQMCDRLRFLAETQYWLQKGNMEGFSEVQKRVEDYCKGKIVRVLDENTYKKIESSGRDWKTIEKCDLSYAQTQSDKPLRYDLYWANMIKSAFRDAGIDLCLG